MINKKAVVVTTSDRGLFFGYIEDDENCPKSIDLSGARNCLYWTKAVRGFIGLAITGPLEGCRIGPKCTEITLYNITSVIAASEKAIKKWEAEPWT